MLRSASAGRGLLTAYAYTGAELLNLLPGGLELDKNTYVASVKKRDRLNAKELSYPYAHLHVIKTLGGDLLSGYFHHHRNIGFRKDTDGKMMNLLSSSENLAESLAGLILDLIAEGKLLL